MSIIAGNMDGVGTFNSPTGLALNALGTTLFVSDTNNHVITTLDVQTGIDRLVSCILSFATD